MKTASDPRHQKRRKVVKELFAQSFSRKQSLSAISKEILAQSRYFDKIIGNAATAWPIDKLNRIDLAILRLAIYELKQGQTPAKVIIDEAVELAKEFGSESSSSFVNGVLGSVYANLEKKNG